jgi:hypothetical protein
MNFVEQLTAIALLVDFLFGVTLGVIGSAAFGSARENRQLTLLRRPPDPVSAGARVLFGVFTRDDGYLQSLPPDGHQPARDRRGDDSTGFHGQGLGR